MEKQSLTVFLSIILLSIHCSSTSCHGKITKNSGCIVEERKALLKFRQSFSYNWLSSWNDTDCCAWEGVACDNVTGHVTMLGLHGKLLGDLVDSSLLELKYLRHLDLSFNDFQLSPIPVFLGSIKYLQYLDLSSSNFSEVVPHSLGNLSSLHVLNLGTAGRRVNVDDLTWASNLTLLQHLDLSFVDLSQTKDPMKVLSMLPNLIDLNLQQSGIGNTNINIQSCVNSSSLASIQYLNLRANSFHGEFPCFIRNMTSLKVLDLSYNVLSGPIPTSFGELSALTSLDLSQNHVMSGFIPASLGNLTALTYLGISDNNLSGPIPPSLGNLRALTVLNIQNNQLSGDIPMSLGQLSNLERIDISNNSFNGTLSEAHFAKLSKLQWFTAEYCHLLTLTVGFDWVPPFQLKSLSLKSMKMKDHQIPQWIQTQKNLTFLAMSNCGIRGTQSSQNAGLIGKLPSSLIQLDLSDNMINGLMPRSLCGMTYMFILNLSRNQLSGSILDCWSKLKFLVILRLSSNELSGVIPNSIGEASSLKWLHLNNNSLTGQLPSTLEKLSALLTLDVGDNKLTGNLPQWIGKNLINLMVIRLRNNEFHGEISSAFCQLPNLQIMDFANNKLTGRIPSCIRNSSTKMSWIFFQSDTLNQVIKGHEREYKDSIVRLMFNLDLSNNDLDGEIPRELTNLSSLINLNLSHNHLGGEIPTNIGNLESLQSLDLSANHLSGIIPRSLSELGSLSYLNLSHNNLSGQIPTGNQLQTLINDPSVYGDNPGLCGPPLPNICPDEKSSESSQDGRNEVEEQEEKIYFYGVVVCGFALGFWGFIGVLVLKRRWRQIYFHCVEVVIGRTLGV